MRESVTVSYDCSQTQSKSKRIEIFLLGAPGSDWDTSLNMKWFGQLVLSEIWTIVANILLIYPGRKVSPSWSSSSVTYQNSGQWVLTRTRTSRTSWVSWVNLGYQIDSKFEWKLITRIAKLVPSILSPSFYHSMKKQLTNWICNTC